MADHALIDHLASLSRLSFAGAEKERMAADMESIMKLMDTIAAVELSEEALEAADGDEALLREDLLGQSMPREQLLANAKDAASPFFAVPKIID